MRAVHVEEVEEDRFARLQIEPADVVGVPGSLDVGNFGEAALGKPLRLSEQERAGYQPRSAVRAGDDLKAPTGGNRIDRVPGAHAGAVDVVIRLVLMPRRALSGPALLDQHMIVVEPDLLGAQQRGSDGGYARVPGQALDRRDLLPPAEVLGKRPRIVGAAGYLSHRPRVPQDPGDCAHRVGYVAG